MYLFIEGCIWLPAAYVFCYRFRPTVRFVQTDTGRRLVTSASNLLERNLPTFHAPLAKLAEKANGAPAGRAAAEWALLNKVLAPVGFPLKMWIAHRVVKARREQQQQQAVASR